MSDKFFDSSILANTHNAPDSITGILQTSTMYSIISWGNDLRIPRGNVGDSW